MQINAFSFCRAFRGLPRPLRRCYIPRPPPPAQGATAPRKGQKKTAPAIYTGTASAALFIFLHAIRKHHKREEDQQYNHHYITSSNYAILGKLP